MFSAYIFHLTANVSLQNAAVSHPWLFFFDFVLKLSFESVCRQDCQPFSPENSFLCHQPSLGKLRQKGTEDGRTESRRC